MGKITTADKATGQQFSAAEYNEIKTVVNGLDDAVQQILDGAVSEIQSFTADGVTAAFTMTGDITAVLLVFADGRLQRSTIDYTLSGATVTFTSLPATGTQIQVLKGVLAPVNTGDSGDKFSHFIYSGSTSFDLGASVTAITLVDVINTTRSIYDATITLSGSIITINHVLEAGDSIRVYWK